MNVVTLQTLKVELRHGVQWIYFRHPEVFNETTVGELRRVFKMIDVNSVKAAVISGTGATTFCEGADVKWMQRMQGFSREEHLRESYALFDMIYAVWACPIPVIARVNGDAFGAGLGLLSACDMAFGVSSAKFSVAEAKLGMIPTAVAPFLVHRLGQNHARRYLLTAESFTASKAKELGLLQEVVETGAELEETVAKAVEDVSANSPERVRELKQLIRSLGGRHSDPIAGRDVVSVAIANARHTLPADEGSLLAILAHRPPAIPANLAAKAIQDKW